MHPKSGLPTVARRVRTALREWQQTPALRVSSDPSDVESVTIRYRRYALTPAWLLPSIADYVMHRRTRIAETSGLRESAIHSLMMAEIAVPVTLTLLCEVNPLLLTVAGAALSAHEATAIWDVRTAVDGGREVRPAEQHIHSGYLAAVGAGSAALITLPYTEELWRCARASRGIRG